ncbi:MAG: hypothetical protein Q4P15_09450, partial [Propionibacteriaceae bacterium]|nr:hypothetical protein [Propionibacteriaceae bacterium]
MTFLRTFAAALCALGLGATVSTATALADDIVLDSPGSITGIAWDGDVREILVTDADGSITARAAESGDERSVPFLGEVESVQALSLFDDLLYVGDVGDERGEREFVTVFRIDPHTEITTFRAWDFTYPDGARDARAMALSGKGRIYIVTAGDDPGIYRSVLQPSRTENNELMRVADAPNGVSDAVFLDDGVTLMLRTGKGVELIDASDWNERAATTYADGVDGESITTFGEGRMLVGDASLLRDEPLPEGMTTVTPGASVAPTAENPETSESTEATPAPDGSRPSAVSRTGTIVALVVAAAVAVA